MTRLGRRISRLIGPTLIGLVGMRRYAAVGIVLAVDPCWREQPVQTAQGDIFVQGVDLELALGLSSTHCEAFDFGLAFGMWSKPGSRRRAERRQFILNEVATSLPTRGAVHVVAAKETELKWQKEHAILNVLVPLVWRVSVGGKKTLGTEWTQENRRNEKKEKAALASGNLSTCRDRKLTQMFASKKFS